MFRLVVAVVAAVMFGLAGLAAMTAATVGGSLAHVALWFCFAMAALSIAIALPASGARPRG